MGKCNKCNLPEHWCRCSSEICTGCGKDDMRDSEVQFHNGEAYCEDCLQEILESEYQLEYAEDEKFSSLNDVYKLFNVKVC